MRRDIGMNHNIFVIDQAVNCSFICAKGIGIGINKKNPMFKPVQK
jgi:hypothetical protein